MLLRRGQFIFIYFNDPIVRPSVAQLNTCEAVIRAENSSPTPPQLDDLYDVQ